MPGAERTEYDRTDEAGALGDSERSSYSEQDAPLHIPAAAAAGASAQSADEYSAEDEDDDAPMEDDVVTDPSLETATESAKEAEGSKEGSASAEEAEGSQEEAKETAEEALQRVSRLRVPELRAELRQLDLADDGKRQDLLDRLAAHFTACDEDEGETGEDDARAKEPEEARGSLNAASKFEAALNAESTALFDTVGSFQEAEASAEIAPEASKQEAAPGRNGRNGSDSGASALPVVAPAESAPSAEEASTSPSAELSQEHEQAREVHASAEASEAPAAGFQRILQWATPFLGAPPAEVAASSVGPGEAAGDEGYAVCDELERKLEARSARKRTFGTPEATPATEQHAATAVDVPDAAVAASTFRANLSAAAGAEAVEVEPADAPAAAQSPEPGDTRDGAAELPKASPQEKFTTAEEPEAAPEKRSASPEAELEIEASDEEEAAEEETQDVRSEHSSVDDQEAAAGPADGARASHLAIKQGHVKLGAAAKAQLDPKMDSKMPKQDERLAKVTPRLTPRPPPHDTRHSCSSATPTLCRPSQAHHNLFARRPRPSRAARSALLAVEPG